MNTFLLFLAELFPESMPFWEYSRLPPGMMAAGIFFLTLICAGIAIDAGLVLHWIKRKNRHQAPGDALAERALPGLLLLWFGSGTIGFYLLASWAYTRLNPSGTLEPQAVLFQTAAFHLPVLALLLLLLHRAGIRAADLFGIERKKSATMLGLALLFYLAALPLLWFYSALYQLLLNRLGYDFYLQDIAQLLTAPAIWPVRTALFFITIVVAPLFEEIVFRGILLPFLVRKSGFWPGAVLVSTLFASLHWHIPSFLPLFLLSITFCMAYRRTRSLLVPAGMHAAFNAVTVILLLLMG